MFVVLELFGEKGFIGAIGDDLPSLIPIIVALLIFFSVFSVALNTYNSQNYSFEKKMGMLSVARLVKGDSLLLSVDQFIERCDQAKMNKYPYNFMIAIYGADYDLAEAMNDFKDVRIATEEGLDVFLSGETDTGTEPFFCGYKRAGASEFGIQLSSASAFRTEYTINYYPIAVQTKIVLPTGEYTVVVPGIMAMVVWQ
jgi:hypothetical protein